MNNFKFKLLFDEIISLAKNAGVKDNNATTKIQAVKPNRHTLAIFSPIVSHDTTSEKAPYSEKPVYGGLIDLIKYLHGNKSSRLVSVVNARPSPLGLVNLTENTGVFTMKTNAILSHSLAVLTAEYERLNRLHEYDPYAGYADRANAIYNAIHALKIHASIQDKATTPPRHKNAIQRILGAFVGGVK